MQANDILRTDFLEVEQGVAISEVLGKMHNEHHSEAVVASKGVCLGLLDRRALLKSRVDVRHTKLQGSLIAKVPMIDGECSLRELARLFHASDKNVLPVVDKKNKLLGIVGARDLLHSVKDAFKGKTAVHFCSEKVKCLHESDKISVAMALMNKAHISQAPVLDSSERLMGVVSLIDVLTKMTIRQTQNPSKESSAHARGSKTSSGLGKSADSLNSLPVINLMTKFAVTCKPTDSLVKVIETMHEKRISDVIVADEGKVVCVITVKGLLGMIKG